MYNQGLCYDDVLLRPNYSKIESRSQCDTSTYITEGIKLNIPIIAANMDTVCEKDMAIKMALMGGVGVIHRYMTVEKQAEQIKAVKKYTTKFRTDFYSLDKEATLGDYKALVLATGVKSFPVVNGLQLLGFVTRRDIWGREDNSLLVTSLMKPMYDLVCVSDKDFTEEVALSLMLERKVEQLPVMVKDSDTIIGIVSRKDLNHLKYKYPNKAVDGDNRLLVGAAVGVKLNPDNLIPLIAEKPDFLVIDIAHGHHSLMDKTLDDLKSAYPNMPVIVGNVGTIDAVERYKKKADGIKLNVGPGCFAAGTRVLMASGFYKNIEDIIPGDYVINQDGNPVKVLDAFCTGIRKVSKVRNSIWYEDTYVTPDHLFWVGDLSTLSGEYSIHYASQLDKLSKTTPKQSKYKWLHIGDTRKKALLTPRRINFTLPESFEINLWAHRGKDDYLEYTLKPSYDLGLFFGFFLADGNAHTSYNSKRNSHSGTTVLYFDSKYPEHREKIKGVCALLFPTINFSYKEEGNCSHLTLNYKPITDLLARFGKKENKHLPEEYLVNDPNYLKGLLDGLVLGDGYIEKHGRINFGNTSTRLIELFNTLCYLTQGFLPNNQKKEITPGNLKGITKGDFKQPYNSRINTTGSKRHTKDYQVVKLLEYTDTDLEVPVYDITVDCPTHSFIANNVIVHNSACRTRVVTGFGTPEFSTIRECASPAPTRSLVAGRKGYPYLIADGGITSSGDIVKAVFAGASSVMIGGLLAGTSDSPGKTLRMDGKTVKQFRGMASHEAYLEKNLSLGESVEAFHFEAEGASGYVDYKGETEDFLNSLVQGFKSGMSYAGARTIEELREYGRNPNNFYVVSPMGYSRNGAHHMRVK